MTKNNHFPNPDDPGQFARNTPALYLSRWASIPHVARAVSEGNYALLTPVIAEFIPTLRCPYRCPTCAYRAPKEKIGLWDGSLNIKNCVEMDLEKAYSYLQKLQEGGCTALIFTGGGEPTFHPHFGAIVARAKSLGFELSLSTNGTFAGGDFDPEDVVRFGFNKVRISLDTVAQHDTFHGYDKNNDNWLQVMLKNIERIGQAKTGSQTRVTICVLFDDRNFTEIGALGEIIHGLRGIDSVTVRPVTDFFGKRQVPEHIVDAVAEYLKTGDWVAMKTEGVAIGIPSHRLVCKGGAQRKYTQCRACGLIGGVWPDGRMFICTETNGNDDFCIGDLNEKTLEDIYTSHQYKQVRDRVAAESFQKCPASCRPLPLNNLFECIEQYRNGGTKQQLLDKWIEALRRQHTRPNPWIQA